MCFNVALKNYIKNSIKDNFPDIKVNNIDAWFKMLWNKSFYVNLNTKIDSNVSLEEIQIIIQKWVDSITVENIKDCYIEKSRESYEFKD
ncbi:MAG: hypothetical protein K6E76_04600 [Patescibacteria group bacterium]|nr:hypothetical protein [Patescibacteria group bacterium]